MIVTGSAIFLSFLCILQWYWMWFFLEHLLAYFKTGDTDDKQNSDVANGRKKTEEKKENPLGGIIKQNLEIAVVGNENRKVNLI